MEPLPLVFSAALHTSIVSGSTCSDGSALAVTNTGSHCWLSVSAMLAVASAHTEWPTRCRQGNDSTDGQRRLGIMVTILRKDTHKDVPKVMSLCMAYIYRNARIILELGPGCGYDIGAYRKSFVNVFVSLHYHVYSPSSSMYSSLFIFMHLWLHCIRLSRHFHSSTASHNFHHLQKQSG